MQLLVLHARGSSRKAATRAWVAGAGDGWSHRSITVRRFLEQHARKNLTSTMILFACGRWRVGYGAGAAPLAEGNRHRGGAPTEWGCAHRGMRAALVDPWSLAWQRGTRSGVACELPHRPLPASSGAPLALGARRVALEDAGGRDCTGGCWRRGPSQQQDVDGGEHGRGCARLYRRKQSL
jgi:hypothetical protein